MENSIEVSDSYLRFLGISRVEWDEIYSQAPEKSISGFDEDEIGYDPDPIFDGLTACIDHERDKFFGMVA